MSDYARKEFENMKRKYGEWRFFPDHIPQRLIDDLATSHSKMTLRLCQYCGIQTREADGDDRPSTCQVCMELGR